MQRSFPTSPAEPTSAESPSADRVLAPRSAVEAARAQTERHQPGLATRFEREVVPLLGQLKRRAQIITRNHADAEDLLQETMLRAYAGFGSYQPGTNPKAWLNRIMHNTFISGYRKRQRRTVEVLRADLPDWQRASQHIDEGAAQRGAEDEALERLPDPLIKAAMEALPEPFRKAVYYADVHGFHNAELARILNCPKGTVTSRLARGRRRLRALLTDSDYRSHPLTWPAVS